MPESLPGPLIRGWVTIWWKPPLPFHYCSCFFPHTAAAPDSLGSQSRTFCGLPLPFTQQGGCSKLRSPWHAGPSLSLLCALGRAGHPHPDPRMAAGKNTRPHRGAGPEPLGSNLAAYQRACRAGRKAGLGFPLGYCSSRGSLTSNMNVSLLQVRKPRRGKVGITCLKMTELVGTETGQADGTAPLVGRGQRCRKCPLPASVRFYCGTMCIWRDSSRSF